MCIKVLCNSSRINFGGIAYNPSGDIDNIPLGFCVEISFHNLVYKLFDTDIATTTYAISTHLTIGGIDRCCVKVGTREFGSVGVLETNFSFQPMAQPLPKVVRIASECDFNGMPTLLTRKLFLIG